MGETDRAALEARLAERRAALADLSAEIAEIEAALGGAVSPLAPDAFPEMPAVPGLRLAAGHAGVKYRDRDDVMLAE
ncbi:MAG: bifunctional ornithine acetyltransferase/N-acetylglutamate synthase, partial [Pseudomonadota bacterium]